MRILPLAAALLIGATPVAAAAQDMVNLTLPDAAPSGIFSGDRTRDALVAQVLLDRARHSPGVIDGIMGGNTARAIRSFQRANDMEVNGQLTREVLQALFKQQSGDIVQRYTISEDDVNGPFVDVPDGMAEMAKLDRVAYETPLELLAEKFHMDKEFLKALNPDADFGKAGTKITVIVAGADDMKPKVARIEVDKSRDAVRAYAEDGSLLASYPATVGSSQFPSPSGTMKVNAVAPDAKYYFDPEGREWGPDKQLTIPAGPNNPVGGIWIDLSKEGYGIHGSPDPNLIGKTASHGCVRLTNWDAEELAGAVEEGASVEFV